MGKRGMFLLEQRAIETVPIRRLAFALFLCALVIV